MKLDPKAMRYLTAEDFRVLAGVEMGSRNHEVVPTPLIVQLSGLRGGSSIHKSISTLAKLNLISKVKHTKYDGYRLAYGGLDYLALHTHQKNKSIYSVGNRIGVGKESDIIVVADSSGSQRILKIHRLGRISFRSVKSNRDYLRHRSSASWMYMSRLAAVKEHAFMKALREHEFPVPEPIAQNRHTVVMSLVDAFPLRQIASVPDPGWLYSELIDMILRLAKFGLIHGDFNEFNILIKEEPIQSTSSQKGKDKAKSPVESEEQGGNDDVEEIKLIPVLIDFPQMVSMDHTNAEMYFDRDVECVKRYFKRRFGFVSDQPGPFFSDAKKLLATDGAARLDVEVAASGFSKKMAKELETYMQEVGVDGDRRGGDDDDSDDYDEEDEDEEEPQDSAGESEDQNGASDSNGGFGRGTKSPEAEKIGSHNTSGLDIEKLSISQAPEPIR